MKTEPEGDVADRAKAMIAAASKMPPKATGHGRRGSLKEAVALALPALSDLKAKGYTDQELTDFMKSHGFIINPGTLRNYMAWATRELGAEPKALAPKPPRAATATPASAYTAGNPPHGKAPPPSALAGRPAAQAGKGPQSGKAGLGHRLNDSDL